MTPGAAFPPGAAAVAVALAAALAYLGIVAADVRGPVRLVKVVPALALAWATRHLPPAFPAAFVLSAAGDAFLLDKDRFLLPGLGAFLLAHLAFVAGFLAVATPGAASAAVLGLGLGVAGVVLTRVWPRLHGVLRVAVPVYALVLVGMAATATALGPAGLAGGLLFLVSDALLAMNRFARPLPGRDLSVLVTYYAALLLLAAAAAPGILAVP